MQIIKIEDEYFAVKSGITLSDEDITNYQAKGKPDLSSVSSENYPDIDFPASRTIRNSLFQDKIPAKAPLQNELSDNTEVLRSISNQGNKDGYVYVHADYEIHDKEIPDGLKNRGLHLNRTMEYYRLNYDDKAQKYILTDLKNQPTKLNTTRAFTSAHKGEITLVDKFIGLSASDLHLVGQIHAAILALKTPAERGDYFDQLPPKEKSLYSEYFYFKTHYLDIGQKHYSTAHECRHVLNWLNLTRRRQDSASGALSIENHLRLLENDEKSAHLAETLLGVKRFYTKNRDFRVFPSKCQWLVKELKKLPPDEVDAKLQDMNYIVNGTLRNWNKNYSKGYRGRGGQFEQMLLNMGWDYPPYQIGNDEAEYLAQRSLLFTFEVYNPKTKKSEIKDLSAFIQQDVDVSKQQKLITRVEKQINNRRKQLARMGITADICAQMQQGTLPHNYTTQEPAPQPQQQQPAKPQQQQPTPTAPTPTPNKPKPTPTSAPAPNKPTQAPSTDNKLTLDQQITPSTKPQPQSQPQAPSQPAAAPSHDDFKSPYRKFYQQKAKQEGSTYREDTQDPHFNATLARPNGEELNIIATQDNHASLGAKDSQHRSKIPNQQDFNDLVKLAQSQGKNIVFGNIKTPEYKARLMLACLINGIQIKQFPSFEEMQQFEPQTRRQLMHYKLQQISSQLPSQSQTQPRKQPNPKVKLNPDLQQYRQSADNSH